MIPAKLPFFFEATKKNNNDGFPKEFPIHIFYDKLLGMYRQKKSKKLANLLTKVYKTGSMLSGGLNDGLVGKSRIDAVLTFIKKNYEIKEATKILEIGCGEGDVLKNFSNLGAICTGLEPGPQIKKIHDKKINLIKDFFPSRKLTDKFDLITHFNVLEHIDDPVLFLQQQKNLLTEDGSIICCFPNCEPFIKSGDISIFIHEHFNYFTRSSVKKLTKKAGLLLKQIEIGAEGGFIFAHMKPAKNIVLENTDYSFYTGKIFEESVKKLNNAISKYLKSAAEEEIAIYCPIRALNLLSVLKINNVRIVDDNKDIYKKYLPGLTQQIENFTDLKKNPPKKLLIFSQIFGKSIKQRCINATELKSTEIKTILDLV
jgi:2-polyprenyl-3-methyl-5-hydroxy-6-metoxy-1,4-benzoquinol methylase